MLDSILEFEPTIRLSFFLGVFAVVALWEIAAPRRQRSLGRLNRWPSNLGIVVLNTVVMRVLFPVAAVAMAVKTSANGWGLFNLVDLPLWLEVVLAVIILDAAIYLQHVMFHAVPALWRLHRMHHADLDYDVTTGARFHPIEIVLSMVIKLSVVSVLGASPVAVIIFEVMLNATAMFNHGNVRLPLAIDGVLRLLIVTPDMHRVHHSIIPSEANSNFGFSLPWWDRAFGTYRAQPEAGHHGMTIGISSFRDPVEQRLDKMLLQPFRDGGQGYAINAKRGAVSPDQEKSEN
jgi:sterol desaturase/sphingolipid hydroxylase (fatty acid hydroxylase superfamily)